MNGYADFYGDGPEFDKRGLHAYCAALRDLFRDAGEELSPEEFGDLLYFAAVITAQHVADRIESEWGAS